MNLPKSQDIYCIRGDSETDNLELRIVHHVSAVILRKAWADQYENPINLLSEEEL